METIVFAGLGAMGWPMASNLREGGFEVLPYDVDAGRVEAFYRDGDVALKDMASKEDALAHTIRRLGEADALLIMVVNADQVRQLLFDQGMAEAMKPGACIIQMSTIAPGDAAGIHTDLMALRTDLHYVDAPVSGGVVGARAGSLTIMSAGEPEALAVCQRAFEVLGRDLFHAGDRVGQGSAFKAVNQLLCGVHIAVAAEALALAEKNGLDLEVMVRMLGGSAASSWMINDRGPRMILPPDEVTSAVDIFCKDLGIVCETARQSRAYAPLAQSAYQLFVASSERGEGRLDDSQVIRTYQLLNGQLLNEQSPDGKTQAGESDA